VAKVIIFAKTRWHTRSHSQFKCIEYGLNLPYIIHFGFFDCVVLYLLRLTVMRFQYRLHSMHSFILTGQVAREQNRPTHAVHQLHPAFCR